MCNRHYSIDNFKSLFCLEDSRKKERARCMPTLFKNWIVDFTQNIWKSMFGAVNWEQKIFVWKSTINKHMELRMCSVLTIISIWNRRATSQLAFPLFQLWMPKRLQVSYRFRVLEIISNSYLDFGFTIRFLW